MNTRIKLSIEDALELPMEDGLSILSPKQSNSYYYKIPSKWLENGNLNKERVEKLFEDIYGPNWRFGNDDGSRYKVLTHEIICLDENNQEWNSSFHCYIINEEGKIQRIKSEDF